MVEIELEKLKKAKQEKKEAEERLRLQLEEEKRERLAKLGNTVPNKEGAKLDPNQAKIDQQNREAEQMAAKERFLFLSFLSSLFTFSFIFFFLLSFSFSPFCHIIVFRSPYHPFL